MSASNSPTEPSADLRQYASMSPAASNLSHSVGPSDAQAERWLADARRQLRHLRDRLAPSVYWFAVALIVNEMFERWAANQGNVSGQEVSA